MWNHIDITFLHGFDISCASRLHEGLPVMSKGLPVTCHDIHIQRQLQCEHDDVIHVM